MPVILALRNPHMKKRHFDRLRVLIGKDIIDDEFLILNKLLRPDILQLIDKITDVSSLASNEASLDNMLNKIIERYFLYKRNICQNIFF
jgi:dynein heavy chain